MRKEDMNCCMSENVDLVDTTNKKVEVGDTVLVYSESEAKWTTEVIDLVDDELVSIWENFYKRVITPIRLIPPKFLIILVKYNIEALTDLGVKSKTRVIWY